MGLDYRQLLAMRASDFAIWRKVCDPGTSCSFEVGGTNRSGVVGAVYLTDLFISPATVEPVSLWVRNGTSPGTVYLARLETLGTNGPFGVPFHIFPRTGKGTTLHVHVESVGKGTVCLHGGGFIL